MCLVSMSSYENENLEIYEHTNGQIMIRNLTTIVIKSMDDLYALLNAGVQFQHHHPSLTVPTVVCSQRQVRE